MQLTLEKKTDTPTPQTHGHDFDRFCLGERFMVGYMLREKINQLFDHLSEKNRSYDLEKKMCQELHYKIYHSDELSPLPLIDYLTNHPEITQIDFSIYKTQDNFLSRICWPLDRSNFCEVEMAHMDIYIKTFADAGIPNLTGAMLRGNEVAGRGFSALAVNKTFKSITLIDLLELLPHDPHIKAFLAQNRTMETFCWSGNSRFSSYRLDDDDFAALAANPQLKCLGLDLFCNSDSVTTEGIRALARSKSLERLQFYNFNATHLEELAKNTTLRFLDLGDLCLNLQQISAFAVNNRLLELKADFSDVLASDDILLNNTSLISIIDSSGDLTRCRDHGEGLAGARTRRRSLLGFPMPRTFSVSPAMLAGTQKLDHRLLINKVLYSQGLREQCHSSLTFFPVELELIILGYLDALPPEEVPFPETPLPQNKCTNTLSSKKILAIFITLGVFLLFGAIFLFHPAGRELMGLEQFSGHVLSYTTLSLGIILLMMAPFVYRYKVSQEKVASEERITTQAKLKEKFQMKVVIDHIKSLEKKRAAAPKEPEEKKIISPVSDNTLKIAPSLLSQYAAKEHEPSQAIPEDFLCPLSQKMFFDPVLAANGAIYERESIHRRFLELAESKATVVDAITGQELPKTLSFNHEKSFKVRKRLKQNPIETESQYLPIASMLAAIKDGDTNEVIRLLVLDLYCHFITTQAETGSTTTLAQIAAESPHAQIRVIFATAALIRKTYLERPVTLDAPEAFFCHLRRKAYLENPVTLTIPEIFWCPLSGQVFFDPVNAEDGYIYERERIAQHFSTYKEAKAISSPITHKEISTDLVRNRAKCDELENHFKGHPKHAQSQYLPVTSMLAAINNGNTREVQGLLKLDLYHRFVVATPETELRTLADIAAVSTYTEIQTAFTEAVQARKNYLEKTAAQASPTCTPSPSQSTPTARIDQTSTSPPLLLASSPNPFSPVESKGESKEAAKSPKAPTGSSSYFGGSAKHGAKEAQSNHLDYIRHPVKGDGDCGYTALGITRAKAFDLLQSNLVEVRDILGMAVKEALLRDSFCRFLRSKQVITLDHPSILKELDKLSKSTSIIQHYLQYDVLHKQVDSGWAHPCVLQALACIQGIHLCMWRFDAGKLIPHRGSWYDYAVYEPPEVTGGRTDLLFVNGNHFERIEFLNMPAEKPQLQLV